jgi:hypothetical protein
MGAVGKANAPKNALLIELSSCAWGLVYLAPLLTRCWLVRQKCAIALIQAATLNFGSDLACWLTATVVIRLANAGTGFGAKARQAHHWWAHLSADAPLVGAPIGTK